MAIGSLLIFLALLVLVALFVARPLLDLDEEENILDGNSSRLLAERERVLDALAELDMDWKMGKVPQDIYAEQRGQLVAKGAAALEGLERASNALPHERKQGKGAKKTSDELETLIAAYKKQRARRK